MNIYDLNINIGGKIVYSTETSVEALSTDTMTEGTNLFYSEERVSSNSDVLLGLESYNWGNYSTAGLASISYVDTQDSTLQSNINTLETELINATNGIATSLDTLQTQLNQTDYTTAGLATITYVDTQDSTLQSNIDTLETEFINATTGINNTLDSLQIQVDAQDYTTAGLATITYVDTQDATLQTNINNFKTQYDSATTGINNTLTNHNNRISYLELESVTRITEAFPISFSNKLLSIGNRTQYGFMLCVPRGSYNRLDVWITANGLNTNGNFYCAITDVDTNKTILNSVNNSILITTPTGLYTFDFSANPIVANVDKFVNVIIGTFNTGGNLTLLAHVLSATVSAMVSFTGTTNLPLPTTDFSTFTFSANANKPYCNLYNA